MAEIKRLNRLWGNESLHLKTHIEIPLYGNEDAVANNTKSSKASHSMSEEHLASNNESLNDIFKRIDLNIKKTSHNVNRLRKDYRYSFWFILSSLFKQTLLVLLSLAPQSIKTNIRVGCISAQAAQVELTSIRISLRSAGDDCCVPIL